MANAPGAHGLAADLNGFLYIGIPSTSEIMRVTCDGEILDSSFITDEGGCNVIGYNNVLYINTWNDSSADNAIINAYDPCTGNDLGSVCLNQTAGSTHDWGFHVNLDTGTFYATSTYDGSTSDNY